MDINFPLDTFYFLHFAPIYPFFAFLQSISISCRSLQIQYAGGSPYRVISSSVRCSRYREWSLYQMYWYPVHRPVPCLWSLASRSVLVGQTLCRARSHEVDEVLVRWETYLTWAHSRVVGAHRVRVARWCDPTTFVLDHLRSCRGVILWCFLIFWVLLRRREPYLWCHSLLWYSISSTYIGTCRVQKSDRPVQSADCDRWLVHSGHPDRLRVLWWWRVVIGGWVKSSNQWYQKSAWQSVTTQWSPLVWSRSVAYLRSSFLDWHFPKISEIPWDNKMKLHIPLQEQIYLIPQ